MSAVREEPIQRILVASDTHEALLRGMERAVSIQRMTGAAVTAVLVTYDPVTEILIERYSADVSQRVIDDLVRNERAGLESALAPLRASMTKLDVEVVFARQTASAFCAAARDHGASLIVKPLAASAHRADFLHAPVDWQLMREAPCPVLFTRAEPWPTPARVLATVDVSDVAHDQLNADILRLGAEVAATVGAEFHVATAVPALAPYVRIYEVAPDYASTQAHLRTTRREALTALLQSVGVEATATACRRRPPRGCHLCADCGIVRRVDRAGHCGADGAQEAAHRQHCRVDHQRPLDRPADDSRPKGGPRKTRLSEPLFGLVTRILCIAKYFPTA